MLNVFVYVLIVLVFIWNVLFGRLMRLIVVDLLFVFAVIMIDWLFVVVLMLVGVVEFEVGLVLRDIDVCCGL